MTFTLDHIVPWGRSMDEYISMFALSQGDLNSRILGCADGPASFNAEMNAKGRVVISVDPIYQFSSDEIQGRIDRTYPTVMQQLRDNAGDYVWTHIHSPEALGRLRMESMNRFLADFPKGVREGRYLPHDLPTLPFGKQTFELAVCSHFLFLYSDQLSAQFHLQAIEEMLRVAREIRIFPLQTLGGQPSPYLDAVWDYFHKRRWTCTIRAMDYEFQRAANQMLQIR